MTVVLPTNRDENWRYANLRPLAKAKADAVATAETPAIELPPALPGFERWVLIDGHHAPQAKNVSTSAARVVDAREAGVALTTMLDNSIAEAGVDFALARVNAARGDEVLLVELPDNSFANVEVLFVASAGAGSGTSYPRLQVQAGRNVRLNLVERHLSAGVADSAVNAAADIAVGAGAEVSHTRLQHCADAATCVDTLLAHVADNASYKLRTVTLGALASRSTAFIKLAGRAARCELTAASIANGLQTHDMFAEIEHAGADAMTREMYRGIATDRGKLGFNGKMVVRESAHGADSEQSLKSLLTGNGAEASMRPQLEIYTDRVRAQHGATTGKLDDQMLFYLLSRGIDRRTAQTLLQWAFIEDAVSRVDNAELRADIEQLVAAQLNEVSALEGLLGKP